MPVQSIINDLIIGALTEGVYGEYRVLFPFRATIYDVERKFIVVIIFTEEIMTAHQVSNETVLDVSGGKHDKEVLRAANLNLSGDKHEDIDNVSNVGVP